MTKRIIRYFDRYLGQWVTVEVESQPQKTVGWLSPVDDCDDDAGGSVTRS